MKDLLKKIWEKIKEYKATIIMYLMMLVVSVVCDVIFSGFNIFKYGAYAIVLIVLVIVMIKYKAKIKEVINDVENSIDNKLKRTNDRLKDLVLEFQEYILINPNPYMEDFFIGYNGNNDIFILYKNNLMSITNFCNMFVNSENVEIAKYSKAILQLLADKK